MKSILDIVNNNGAEFISSIIDNYVTVQEKIAANSIMFKRMEDAIHFYKGTNTSDPINEITQLLTSYYEDALDHLKKVTELWVNEIPLNWEFRFRYIKDNKPSTVQYGRVPESKLILIDIRIPYKKKIITDPIILKKWADRFAVEYIEPIFQGYLSPLQKEKLMSYFTDYDYRMTSLNDKSFAEVMLSILNPEKHEMFLNNDLKQPIDSLIFKFYKVGQEKPYVVKLIDPYTEKEIDKIESGVDKMPYDVNELLLFDFLTFIQNKDFDNYKLRSDNKETRYIELMCKLFNEYYDIKKNELSKMVIPKMDFDTKSFAMNYSIIPNDRTREIVKSDKTVETVYKILLGSFRKYRNPNCVGNIMTPYIISTFNAVVDDIRAVSAEKSTEPTKMLSFNDFFGYDK